MVLKTVAFLVGICVLGAGCATTTIGEHFQKHALNRASFEMQCPKERLQIKGLNEELERLGPATGDQVGVSGCGKHAVYVLTQNGWILNSGGL
jgi:hypothetical protein